MPEQDFTLSDADYELFKQFDIMPDIQCQLGVKSSPNKYLAESKLFDDGAIKFSSVFQKDFLLLVYIEF